MIEKLGRRMLIGLTLGGLGLAVAIAASWLGMARKPNPPPAAADLDRLARPPALTIEVTERGGHCGFIMDWSMRSWIDGRMAQLFSQRSFA